MTHVTLLHTIDDVLSLSHVVGITEVDRGLHDFMIFIAPGGIQVASGEKRWSLFSKIICA